MTVYELWGRLSELLAQDPTLGQCLVRVATDEDEENVDNIQIVQGGIARYLYINGENA